MENELIWKEYIFYILKSFWLDRKNCFFFFFDFVFVFFLVCSEFTLATVFFIRISLERLWSLIALYVAVHKKLAFCVMLDALKLNKYIYWRYLRFQITNFSVYSSQEYRTQLKRYTSKKSVLFNQLIYWTKPDAIQLSPLTIELKYISKLILTVHY